MIVIKRALAGHSCVNPGVLWWAFKSVPGLKAAKVEKQGRDM